MRYLVGANRTLIDHFADIGNMVVIPGLTGNLLFPFDWNSKRNEFGTFRKKHQR